MLLLYALSKSLEYHSKTSKYGVNVGNEKKHEPGVPAKKKDALTSI